MTDRTTALDRAVRKVVDSDNCSGCGACTLLDSGLAMRLDRDGFNRPMRVGPTGSDDNAVARFQRACPGARVAAQRPTGTRRHPTMGPVYAAWEAWAADEDTRYRGSSGGALTALAAWLTESGRANLVVGARSDEADPRHSVSVAITSRAEALASAGSRYAPVSNAGHPYALSPDAAFIGKPCEVSALRAMAGSKDVPILLSFFCAGTPSQSATDTLLESMGVGASDDLDSLSYRGRGWPGEFRAVRPDGSLVAIGYEQSWGQHLGRAVQWRCKICPDGVGESADITAADFWRADDRGFPDFTDGAGVSALIARTRRGYEIVNQAVDAGVLSLTPIEIDDLAAVQPLQRSRRETLAGRLAGTRAAGGITPRYRGFSLIRLALPRLRESVRAARGTFRRRRGIRPS